ncbi:hypothetical protein RN607_00845 [Demequina capsici]|uniref:Leucine rich repeat variant domain-containing protein n=1 Tax=Demequina capsici TaxID=3075620 RepID=A0AA96FFD4_9MICO|nr:MULTISPECIES: hypothetical protein [unclassified Demequina]WNM24673.1 hypothetical protein RN606_00565 [Demequina sp. OYTSA14]WNM27581.1 hypothetical protein RN607_00845 [Demequina sp. PMTSA13]
MVFIGAAAALSTIENASYPPLLWVLPLVPLMVIAVLIRDALVGGTGRRRDGFDAMGAQVDGSESSQTFTTTIGTGEVLASDPEASPEQLAEIAYAQPTLRPVVAANPSTPASLLEWLAALGDPAVQRAIGARAAH